MTRVALDPDHPRAARCLENGGLEVRHLGTGELLASVTRDLGEVRALAFVPGRDLLLCSQGAHVRCLELGAFPGAG